MFSNRWDAPKALAPGSMYEPSKYDVSPPSIVWPMLRYLTAGESHGPGLVAIVEGVPAGLAFDLDSLAHQLERRRSGHGRGNRMKLERDELEVLGGVRHGRTLGSPIAVVVRNTEWPRWSEDMAATPGEPKRTLTTPRPGHADLVGMQKYDTHDARDILERASARETAARTVVGYVAGALLAELGVAVLSHVVAIGEVSVPDGVVPGPGDLDTIDEDPVRCFHPESSAAMVAAIDAAKADRDTLGGVVEVVVHGLWPGLGSHVHWDRKLDARLAGALMSIQAIKGVEVGDGFATTTRRGSAAHDEILPDGRGGFARASNRAGGTEGGMSTGEPLRVRAAMKPISTLMRALRSVDVTTKQPDTAFRERSDVCAVPRAGVVAEHVVAAVVADETLRQFGGDTVGDVVAALDRYRARVAAF
jgi:chorismate synthase